MFKPSLLIQTQLEITAEKAAEAAKLATDRVSSKKASIAWNTIKRAAAAGDLKEEFIEAIKEFVEFHTKTREPQIINEPIRLTPLIEVISENDGFRFVKGPYGIGAEPIGSNLPNNFRCGVCGSLAWNGARCVVCGNMNDD